MSHVPVPKHFQIDAEQYGDTAFVRLTGEFDVSGEDHFDRRVRELEAESRTLVIDLSGLTFIDSSGLRALLRTWRRASENGHDIAFVPGSDQVKRTMELTGLDGVLPVVADGAFPPGPGKGPDA